jgi:hypothetical protein
MATDDHPSPRHYLGITVSSTFTDLKDHRAALIKAIKAHGLTDLAMENDSAKDMDVIDSSLQMVRDGSAYIGVISKKYGQIPRCPRRNPDNLSITELEFNEALRLGRPILLFIMGKDHLVREDHVETIATKRKKLNAFRERAKKMRDSSVHRVYATFNSLEEFKVEIGASIAELRPHLGEPSEPTVTNADKGRTSADQAPIPKPPAFYAEPAYIGYHTFIGRQAQLDVLSDWAQPADSHTVLLFEAIGGTGKSMLTWEWTTQHATKARTDWAGRFWYSFYERGAIMADFCRRALAYITGQPLEQFHKKKTPELANQLLHHLQARPWLFILDGLERVLVAYHRIDAAEVPDEDANMPTDKIVGRDPCAAIRPEDDDLLRALASVAPSKVLVSSRLVPRVLLNKAGQAIPGVQRISLPGLRPADAEALLRSCGATGDSRAIQDYLTRNCDCHPLVIGVLAGLINDYLPDKGNFDAWEADPIGGGQLNLANLDLIHRRNHILKAGLDALSEKSRQLLSTLALLSEAVDYSILRAFNPHLPLGPADLPKPNAPEGSWRWDRVFEEDKRQARNRFQAALRLWEESQQVPKPRLQPAEALAAEDALKGTVRDLERRGLLQYDGQTKHWDLHPVVRGIAAGGLRPDEKEHYGERVIDYFSQQAHRSFREAKTLQDVHDGINIVRTLLRMGRQQQAFDVYFGELSGALYINLEARAEILSLLRPFFTLGWATLPLALDESSAAYLAADAAKALELSGERQEALAANGAALHSLLGREDYRNVRTLLINMSSLFNSSNRLAASERCVNFSLGIAAAISEGEDLFSSRLERSKQLTEIGLWEDAEAIWQLLDPMGRAWSRALYRPGDAEHAFATLRFERGALVEHDLARAEQLAKEGNNHRTMRLLSCLRGAWRLEQGHWALAAESLHEAVRMAREASTIDAWAETQLALAKFHLGQLTDPRREAEQLAQARNLDDQALAELWLAIGDREQAKKHALAAYKWAWADGEPYVHRYELNKTTALLKQLGTEIPNLPPYDPANDEKFPWEDKVVAAIASLRAEKEAKKNKKGPRES